MITVGLHHFLVLSALLFILGLLAVLTKKNAVTVLMGIELILNAANINFVAFARYADHDLDGQMIAVFVIVTAAALNLIMAGLFWLTSILPPDMAVGPQVEFGMVLSPVWRIVFASILAEVVAELIDTEGYRLWVEKVTHRYQWARVLVSNTFSIPIDSLIFVWFAFGGVLPDAVVWSIFLSNVLIKGATTLISLPGIYLVKEKPPTAE
jgi:uncharacterized integral membrane protein (TIGR00697 family)